jgi:hypothetical protein
VDGFCCQRVRPCKYCAYDEAKVGTTNIILVYSSVFSQLKSVSVIELIFLCIIGVLILSNSAEINISDAKEYNPFYGK